MLSGGFVSEVARQFFTAEAEAVEKAGFLIAGVAFGEIWVREVLAGHVAADEIRVSGVVEDPGIEVEIFLINRFHHEGGGDVEAVGQLAVIFRCDGLSEGVFWIGFFSPGLLAFDLLLTFKMGVSVDDVEVVCEGARCEKEQDGCQKAFHRKWERGLGDKILWFLSLVFFAGKKEPGENQKDQ